MRHEFPRISLPSTLLDIRLHDECAYGLAVAEVLAENRVAFDDKLSFRAMKWALL